MDTLFSQGWPFIKKATTKIQQIFFSDGICNQAGYDVITELCEDCDWHAMRGIK